jgi:Fur family ferric uptake transcriptional regulator
MISPTAQEWLAALHGNGYRLTAARSAVVQTVAGTHHALTPHDVYSVARACYPALGLVSVYRTLEKLEELGLIQRVHGQSGCQAFISTGTGHQHLLLCQKCGRIAYFEGDDLSPLIASIASRTGYNIREHWLQLFGLCSDCQRTN